MEIIICDVNNVLIASCVRLIIININMIEFNSGSSRPQQVIEINASQERSKELTKIMDDLSLPDAGPATGWYSTSHYVHVHHTTCVIDVWHLVCCRRQRQGRRTVGSYG